MLVASHSNSTRVTGQPHLSAPVSRIYDCNPSGKAEEQTSEQRKPLISARMAHSKSSPAVVTTREELAGRSGATLTCGTTAAHGTHRSRWLQRGLLLLGMLCRRERRPGHAPCSRRAQA